ncbi:MAG: glutamyl-tRNA reductase [Akkermansia sp.]|nr:glutamyl-tRNA reductase [Akkermansia sp.]
MHMYCLGVNYRNCPVAVREQFAVPRHQLSETNLKLASLPGVQECVLLSTCNRTEIYYWSTSSEDEPQSAILSHFLGNAPASETRRRLFYLHRDEEALFHLAAVASGLDSMVLGETEIFGQLKDAYQVALEAGTTASFANRTFQRVFTVGKKVRSSSHITSGPTSVGAAAVQMAQGVFKELAGAQVLVVGAGEVARTTAQSLRSRGAQSIFVANRSYERAVDLASQVGGNVIRFTEWIPYLENIDIVIVSTASPAYVVSPQVLEQVQQTRRRPLFLIDLSVPRNVNPACSLVDDVYVYDMDALEEMTAETRRQRSAEIYHCEQIIREWLREDGKTLFSLRAGQLQQD